jgi:hypothetical protein
VLAPFVSIACTVAAAPSANAAVTCSISNSAVVLRSLFSMWYIDAVRTGGSCDGEVAGLGPTPYTCDVLGVVIGDIAAPPVVFGASLQDPLENYCSTTSSAAITLRDCQQWLVVSRFIPYDGNQQTQSTYESACE